MAYKVKNISTGFLYENLDTKDADGKREVLSLKKREEKTLSDEQWASVAVQKHIKKGRIRSTQA